MKKTISSKLINSPIKQSNLEKQKSFHIRRRKTFLVEPKSTVNKNDIKNRSSLAYINYNTLYNKRRNSLNNYIRKKSTIPLSKKEFKDLEEDVRLSILEMRRSCLWEIRRQSQDIANIFEKSDIKTRSEIGLDKAKEKFSLEYLEDLNNGKQENNLSIKIKKCNTFNHKNKKSIEKNRDKKDNNNNGVINMNINDDNVDKKHFGKKFMSSQALLNFGKNKKKHIPPGEKFRFLSSGGQIIDSHNESESDEDPDPDGFIINPEKKFIYIYDAFIALAALYSLIYIPIEIAKNACFCTLKPNFFNTIINYSLDILFIIDFLIGFFRAFYTKEDEKLIKNEIRIINNYLGGWFIFDLLTSLPINISINYFCQNHKNIMCFTFEKKGLINYILLSRCLKAIKVIKISTRKKNQFVTEIIEKISDITILGNFLDLFSNIFFVITGLHLLSCIHIFIGKHVYPGWIFKNEFQNFSSLNLYMISLYYMITTMTTVGYGEIQSDSFIEIIFRIILLAVGIICYSWVISSISNGINKQSYASINFSNECLVLENIRRSHRELPYKIYFAIKKHLEFKHFRQKKYDKDLLINSLPYSLKNSIIFSMYKPVIENFHFFKGISNSNFLVETLSYFTPISGKKNETFIKENELFEEIYFVLEGRLALEVPINMNNPEESVNKYLSNEFLDFAFDFDFEANFIQHAEISNIANSNLMDSDIHATKRTSFYNSFIVKNKDSKKYENNVYLKIHDIHKNEDFGDIYVFFGKRSPFAFRARTKRVKLYSIKKDNFANLCEEYQHLFRRIHKKKKHNYKIIKNIFIKTISKFCDSKGIRIKEMYKDKINRAIKELQKENIPIEILKNSNKNEMNEIDEEINNTIKEFDNQIHLIQEEIYGKKWKKLLKINTTTGNNLNSNIIKNKINLYNGRVKGTAINKGIKNSFLEDLDLEDASQKYYFTNSIKGNFKLNFNKNKIKKNLIKNNKKKKKKIKTVIRSNIMTNLNLKGYNFDFSESDESIKTVKINENYNDGCESPPPNTIKILPQSLINLLKTKINYQQLLNQKDNSIKSVNILSKINFNSNKNITNNNKITSLIDNNTNNNNRQSKLNTNSIIKSKNMSSSCFTFDKLLNNHLKGDNKEISNIINSRLEKSSYSRNNYQNRKNPLNNTRMSSIRDTLTPKNFSYFSPKSRGRNIRSSVFSQNQFNNYQKCSITNNNILLKLDGKILNKNNSFNLDNLSSTTADSFQIKASYKNINEVSNGAYIKEEKFQKDTIQFIMDYKNNKNKAIKRKKSNYSSCKVESPTNFGIYTSGNIKKVDSRMSQYLNKKIKIIKKKTLNSRKKSPFLVLPHSNKKNIKKVLSNNISLHSSNNINDNSNLRIKNLNEDTISKLNNDENDNNKYDDS